MKGFVFNLKVQFIRIIASKNIFKILNRSTIIMTDIETYINSHIQDFDKNPELYAKFHIVLQLERLNKNLTEMLPAIVDATRRMAEFMKEIEVSTKQRG